MVAPPLLAPEAVAGKEATACAAPAAIIAHDQRLRVSGAASFHVLVKVGGTWDAGRRSFS